VRRSLRIGYPIARAALLRLAFCRPPGMNHESKSAERPAARQAGDIAMGVAPAWMSTESPSRAEMRGVADA
jgi:hypothetical protein